MASNLTGQVRNIAEVATAVASGDLSRKITVDVRGEILQLKEAINTMVDQLRSFASEVTRVLAKSARMESLADSGGGGVAGTWKDLQIPSTHGRQPHRPGSETLLKLPLPWPEASVAQNHGRRER